MIWGSDGPVTELLMFEVVWRHHGPMRAIGPLPLPHRPRPPPQQPHRRIGRWRWRHDRRATVDIIYRSTISHDLPSSSPPSAQR